MTFVLIRHGNKKYDNNYGFRGLDSPLNCDKFPSLDNWGQELKKLGARQIVSSPFLRCRQTAQLVNVHSQQDLPLIVDRELTEYLGHRPPRDVTRDFYPDTLGYDPLIVTQFAEYQERAISYCFQPQTIYVVHGLFIKLWTRYFLDWEIEVPEFSGIIYDHRDQTGQIFCPFAHISK